MHENNGYKWQLEKAPKTVDLISINRTLLVQKLTDKTALRPIIVRDLTSIEAVFAHFKPEVDIEFKDSQGNIYCEILRFNALEDFGKKGIIKQSHFLQSQNSYSEDDLRGLLRELRANIALRRILEDVDAKEAFLVVIRIMMDEMLDFSLISSSTFHDLLGAGVKQQGSTDQNSREDANQLFKQSIKALFKYGGFDLIAKVITGASNLNPACQERKKIFLFDKENKIERNQLHQRLHLWHNILSYNNFISDAIDKIKQHIEDYQRSLFYNLKMAIEATHELEQAYRSVALFFQNAGQIEVKNISFLNADKDQLQDLDNTTFVDAVASKLEQNYDRLHLRDNYSLLVVPGYLGSNKVVDKWAKIAHKNKVILVTDFDHFDTLQETIEQFNKASLKGDDVYKSNVTMAANWLLGRDKLEEIDEEDDLFVPPSAALAGYIYAIVASQLTSGIVNLTTLRGVENVKFKLNRDKNSSTGLVGLTWVACKDNQAIVILGKTLFDDELIVNTENYLGRYFDNQSNVILQNILMIYASNYVAKSLINIINSATGNGHLSPNDRLNAQSSIIQFLEIITGPNKLLERFAIRNFESEGDYEHLRINLDIYLMPYSLSKTFLLSLEGNNLDDNINTRYIYSTNVYWTMKLRLPSNL